MSDELPLLSIVCPAYEEEAVLPLFHAALSATLETLAGHYRCEILYVDDGSRDRTLSILRRLATQDGRVRYLSLSRNFGNQAALTAGLEHAAGDVVVTIDSDLQHPPALIPTLLAKWREGYDVVITSRSSGTEQAFGWLKRKSSAAFHRLMQRWSEVDVRVNSTDFRLLSRRAVNALLQLRETHRYVRGMVQWLGFPTFEVTFPADSRRAGETKFTAGRLLRFGFDSLLSFSRMPLRVATIAGLAITALSLVVSLALVLLREPNLLTAALLVAVHLIGGCVLIAVGVTGAYVTRIYEECKARPLYVLKEAFPTLGTCNDPQPLTARPTGEFRQDSNAA